MGALVTLDLADDSPVLSLPWIITFGPLGDDEEWEPVVCGPYERAHALALAETVVADEQLMAVVEPVLPHASVEEIRQEITSAKAAAEAEEDEFEFDEEDEEEDEGAEDDIQGSVDEDFDEHDDHEHDDHDHDDHDHDDEEDGFEEVEPTAPPAPEEVRAGFARIAARLTAAS